MARLLLLFLLSCLGVGQAFASSANTPYGAVTFSGNHCQDLLFAVTRAYLSAGGVPTVGAVWFGCSYGNDLAVGSGSVSYFYSGGVGSSTVSVSSLDSVSSGGSGTTTGTVSLDLGGLTQWVNLSAEDGALLAGALISMWMAGFAIRSIIDVVRGSDS